MSLSARIDTEVKDLLVGKAIDASHMTYYGDLRLKNAFVQIRTVALALTQTANEDKDKTIENLRKALEKLEDENTVLQTRIEQLKKRQDLTETTFKEFTKRLTVLEGKKETKKEPFKTS